MKETWNSVLIGPAGSFAWLLLSETKIKHWNSPLDKLSVGISTIKL